MVNDARFRKRIVLQVLLKAFPSERLLLTPPIDPLEDQSFGDIVKSLNSPTITTDAIVLVVASQLRPERRPQILELRCAAYLPEPYVHLLARLAKLLRTGLATQCRITFTTPTPVMGETQKVKGMGLVVLPVLLASPLSV